VTTDNWEETVKDVKEVPAELLSAQTNVSAVGLYDLIQVMMKYQAKETANALNQYVQDARDILDQLHELLGVTRADTIGMVRNLKEQLTYTEELLANNDIRQSELVDEIKAKEDFDRKLVTAFGPTFRRGTIMENIIALGDAHSSALEQRDAAVKTGNEAESSARKLYAKLADRNQSLEHAVEVFKDYNGHISWDDFERKHGTERHLFSLVEIFKDL